MKGHSLFVPIVLAVLASSLAGRYEEVGDIVSPVLPPEAWDVLK